MTQMTKWTKGNSAILQISSKIVHCFSFIATKGGNSLGRECPFLVVILFFRLVLSLVSAAGVILAPRKTRFDKPKGSR